MATSAMLANTHHANPTTWQWNLDSSTTSDTSLAYIEDRDKATAAGEHDSSTT
jgi:hypothetical protein